MTLVLTWTFTGFFSWAFWMAVVSAVARLSEMNLELLRRQPGGSPPCAWLPNFNLLLRDE